MTARAIHDIRRSLCRPAVLIEFGVHFLLQEDRVPLHQLRAAPTCTAKTAAEAQSQH